MSVHRTYIALEPSLDGNEPTAFKAVVLSSDRFGSGSLLDHACSLPANYRNWDPEAPVIAHALIQMIVSTEARLHVEHIGSTSIPGCGGKGYIDLLVMYDDGQLDMAKKVLKDLGFQRQTSRDPFPESRPMRVGSVMHKGRRYRVNAHVVAHESPEVAELIGFRDRRDRMRGFGSRMKGRNSEYLPVGSGTVWSTPNARPSLSEAWWVMKRSGRARVRTSGRY